MPIKQKKTNGKDVKSRKKDPVTSSNASRTPFNHPSKLAQLEKKSMLWQAKDLAKLISNKKDYSQKTFAMPQVEQICEQASVWIDVYPASIITKPGESKLKVLGEEKLWKILSEIGIRAMHLNPIRVAGTIDRNGKHIPTVDGGYDRIDYKVAKEFGSDKDYLQMTKKAAQFSCSVAGNIIPGHTGKGPDFRLAEKNYKDYAGLYAMVEIDKKDWSYLPKLAPLEDSANLTKEQEKIFKEKGYIFGDSNDVLFAAPGVKETNWSATPEIYCVDGKKRRWIYFHVFKTGQPTLNWLDPTVNSYRLLFGDFIKSRLTLGAKILRIDASPLLGAEIIPGKELGWVRGHPLSTIATDILAMFMRKIGGWTFAENAADLSTLAKSMEYGAELSYDFVTRAGYGYAMIFGDARLLNLQIKLLLKSGIDTRRLMHSLQSHDCLNFEIPHLWPNPDEIFEYGNEKINRKELEHRLLNHISTEMKAANIPYDLSYSGVSATFATLAAARLGISEKDYFQHTHKKLIQKALMPAVIFNAMQPGIFQVSGWDLVGAINLKPEAVANLMADGDIRWVERGGYDLLGTRNNCPLASNEVPKAKALFGGLAEQINDRSSFLHEVRQILSIREKWKFSLGKLVAILPTNSLGTCMFITQLAGNKGFAVTAVNFSKEEAKERINWSPLTCLKKEDWHGKRIEDALTNTLLTENNQENEFALSFAPFESKVLIVF